MADKKFFSFRKRNENKAANVVSTSKYEPKIAVGLDIGTTKVVAFAGKRNSKGKIEILGYGKQESLGVQRGLVINIAHTAKAIQNVIQQLKNTANLEVDTVMVGIAGQHINNIRVKGEIKRQNPDIEISKDDIKQLTDDMFRTDIEPGKQILDAIPQEYDVDNYPSQKDPIGMLGTRLSSEFNVITCSTQHIKNIGRCIKKCELNMEGLVLEPIASAEVVLDESEKEVGVALVDIGGGTTDIVVFVDGIMRHTAVIPIAGDVITEDIKKVFKGITKEQAETMKKQHGSVIPNEADKNQIISIPGIHDRDTIEISKYQLAEVIHARMKDILERIHAELVDSGCFNIINCGIVFTGGGAQINGLKELAAMRMGVSVRIGNPEQKLEFNDKELSQSMYATGLGLMVLSIEKDEDIQAFENNNNNENYQENTDEDDFEDSDQEIKKETRQYRPWKLIRDLLERIVIENEPIDEDKDDDFDDDDRV